MRIFKGFVIAGAILGSAAAFGQGRLPPEVLQALRAANVPEGSVSAVVQEVSTNRPTIAVNAARAVNPASVMKLVTTYTALEVLGPAYKWKTEAYLDGADLVLKGYGDPKLNYEAFWILLRHLRGKGLKDLRGDLVLDRSYFAPMQGDPGGFDGEVLRPYNVLPDALLVNFKSLRFSFVPDPARPGVRIYAEPHPPGLEITNTLRLAESGGCPEGRAFREMLQAAFDSGAPSRAAFTGRYPLSCGEKELNVALLNPAEHVAGVMRLLWTELGGTWHGRVREGLAPIAPPLHVQESAALAEIVRDINKFSNNVMARQLYLTLAAQGVGPPARLEEAFAVVKTFLERKGIKAPELVMENGSGLSRIERISAAHLATLLAVAWRSPVMPEFIASLPIAGADGTLRKRMQGEALAGAAHVKTGLLNDVSAMAGYVLDRTGKRQIVVLVINHPNAPQAQAAQDAFLAWVFDARARAPSTGHPPGSGRPHP